MAFSLHPRLAADTLSVGRLALSDVLLAKDSRYLWCILVPQLENLRDFHDVPHAHKAAFLEEIDRTSAAVQAMTDAYKINVAALGNVVEQLHVHVIARHQGDPAWPGPIWGVGNAVPYGPEAAAAKINELRAALGCEDGPA